MPRERQPPDQPAEWLNRAMSDLVLAETRVAGVYLEDLCYHAQQAAEKALKALFLFRGLRFPYVHDLAELVGQLEKSALVVPPEVKNAVTLTEYAVAGRYPGLDEPATVAEWREAIGKARSVVAWVEAQIAPESQPPKRAS